MIFLHQHIGKLLLYFNLKNKTLCRLAVWGVGRGASAGVRDGTEALKSTNLSFGGDLVVEIKVTNYLSLQILVEMYCSQSSVSPYS